MNFMGFDISKLVHEIVHPFAGTMAEVLKEIKQTNKKLDRIITLLEEANHNDTTRNNRL